MSHAIEGGCYCASLRYSISAEPAFRLQCHCRECQYFSGGHAAVFLGVPTDCFRYSGAPREFQRDGESKAVTRDFCPRCGVHLAGRSVQFPGIVLVKVGTLDNPEIFGQAQLVIFTTDRQSFHTLPDGVPTFERVPTE